MSTDLSGPERFLEMVDAAIDALPPVIQRRVHVVCDEYKIPRDLRRNILWWVHRINHFEHHQSHMAPTPKERLAALREVSSAATQVLAALGRLHSVDYVDLQDVTHTAMNDIVPGPWGFEGVAAVLEWGANFLAAELQQSAPAGGRRPVLKHYAAFVEQLAIPAEAAGMRLGANGPFEHFCTAVFRAAGAISENSTAEGAVKEFLRNRKKPVADDDGEIHS